MTPYAIGLGVGHDPRTGIRQLRRLLNGELVVSADNSVGDGRYVDRGRHYRRPWSCAVEEVVDFLFRRSVDLKDGLELRNPGRKIRGDEPEEVGRGTTSDVLRADCRLVATVVEATEEVERSPIDR